MREPRALAVRRSQRNTEEGPRELSLPKVTSRGERLLAPRHSQLNTTNSRLLLGKAAYQDVNEGPTIRSETAIT